jgi:hypothetical protein
MTAFLDMEIDNGNHLVLSGNPVGRYPAPSARRTG